MVMKAQTFVLECVPFRCNAGNLLSKRKGFSVGGFYFAFSWVLLFAQKRGTPYSKFHTTEQGSREGFPVMSCLLGDRSNTAAHSCVPDPLTLGTDLRPFREVEPSQMTIRFLEPERPYAFERKTQRLICRSFFSTCSSRHEGIPLSSPMSDIRCRFSAERHTRCC